MFNALKYTHQLEAVGFRREQAEVQVQFVLDAIETEVATKTDLSELKAELKSEMAEFKSEMKIAFSELKTEMIIKLGATVIGSVTVATAILGFLIKFK